jgi:Ca2+-binding RTX toxin-like protein
MQSPNSEALKNTAGNRTKSPLSWNKQAARILKGLAEAISPARRVDQRGKIRRPYVSETIESRILLAATVWNGSSGGSWFDSRKWSGGVPDSSKDVEIVSTNAGVLTFEGGKAEAASFFVGAPNRPARVDFDLNDGRLTVDKAFIGGPASAESLGLSAQYSKSYNTFGSAYVWNGQLTVDENASVGQRETDISLVGSFVSAKRSEGRLFVGTRGKVDVGGSLLLGSDSLNLGPKHRYLGVGYVNVTSGGQLTTDRVEGWNGSKAYVYGYGAKWLNSGEFAASLWVGAGGDVSTHSFTGVLELDGGSITAFNYLPKSQNLSGGHLIVSQGTYYSVNTSVPNGAALTVKNGAWGDDLGTLSVGGESIFSRGIVTVDSGSTMKWSSINLMRSGELRITGSETRVRSIPQTAVPAPQVKVEGFGAHLSLSDGGQIGGSNFLLQSGGSASVFGTDSLLTALNHIGIGETSSLFPQDSGTSILSVGEGATVFAPGSMTVSSGGALRLSGGLVSTPNLNVDGGGLIGGGQITGSVKIASGGQVNPGVQTLWTNSVLFQTGSRFIASLSGRAAGTQYSQLDVTGATNINGAQLVVSESFTSAPDDEFVIIRNDGSDPVLGTFAGLNEGSVIVNDGVSYTVTYRGGDGNDVVLISNGNLPVIVTPTTATSNNQPEIKWLSVPGAASYTLQVHNISTGQQNFINLSGVTSVSHQVTSPLPLGNYEAYVQAFDASGNASLRSPKRAFTVLPPFSPNVLTDSVDVNIGNGQALDSAGKVSLRATVQESNALAGTDRITLGAGTFTLSRSGFGEDVAVTGDLDITDDLIIEGAGADVTIINANSLDRVFHVRPGGKLTLRNVTITGGLVSGSSRIGGGIYNQGIVNLIDCKLVGNTAYQGGGLATTSPSSVVAAVANVINTTFTGNNATLRGGAIMVQGTSEATPSLLHLDNVTVNGNSAPSTAGGGGAGIYVLDWSDVEIRESLFQNNTAQIGGVIYSEQLTTGAKSKISVLNSQFVSNTAVNSGGVFYIQNVSNLNIEGSGFSQNKTTDINGTGGALEISQGADVINITGTQFLDNESPAWGGAIRAEKFGTFSITDSEFRRNLANRSVGSTQGGAIHARQGQQLLIKDSTFDANEARFNGGKGGAVVIGGVNAQIDGSTFSNNIAAREAGAISASGSSGSSSDTDVTLQISNSTFSGNRAISEDGGALFLASSSLVKLTTTLTNITVTANQSGRTGGGIFYQHLSVPPVLMQNSLMAGNTATTSQPDVSGAFESLGYNLIGNIGATNGNLSATGFGATGDLIGGNGQPVINPLLGPLQDNGGPTFTHALLDGSPALNGGSFENAPERDQRGSIRPTAGSIRAIDIGAYQILTGVNLGPVNRVPVSVITFRNEAVVFDDVNDRLLSVSDFDAGDSDLEVSLSASGGKFTLQSTAGLSLSSDPTLTNLSSKTLIGSLTDLNHALSNLLFVPTTGFSGAATLTITTNDRGNTGSGGAKTDIDIIRIDVRVPFSPNVLTDSVDVNIGNGQALDSAGKVSLRATVQESNALAGTDRITLGAGTFTLSRSGFGEDVAVTGDLDITDDLIIEGAGADVTIINANSLDRVFHVRPGGKLTLRNVTITGGLVSGSSRIGGGIYNQGIVNLIDCKLVGNTAYQGGGLATTSPSSVVAAVANVINTTFTGNNATLRGGAIMVQGTSEATPSLLHLDNVTVNGNSAPSTAGGGGAGIYVLDWSDVEIRESLFQNNTAQIGGVIYSEQLTTGAKSKISVLNSQFVSNTAVNSGGVFYIQNVSNLNIEGSGFSQNKTTDINGTGGALEISQGADVINITGTQFLDNESPAWGGAIRAEKFGTFSITDSEFRRNLANRSVGSTQGGAIHARQGQQLLIKDSTFDANEARFNGGKGGAVVIGGVNAQIDGSTFSNNIAAREAGAISASGSSGSSSDTDVTLQISNSTFSGNRAISEDGGALYLASSLVKLTTTLTHITVTGNQSGRTGGGIFYQYLVVPTVLIQNSLVAGNTATTSQPDVSGAFESLGHNLIGNIGATSGHLSATGFGTTGDLIGGNGQPVINPLLGPLQDNGGPTFTHALLEGSPALEKGVAVDTLLLDQHGRPRMQGFFPDIGAVEKTVDVIMRSLQSDGRLSLTVQYEIVGRNLPSLTIGFFSSPSSTRADSGELLGSINLTLPSDLTVGLHTKTLTIGAGGTQIPFPGVGLPELPDSYHILAVADPSNAIGEVDQGATDNNVASFVGVYHAPGGQVFVHGSPSSDEISVTVGSVRVSINGTIYTYPNADVSNVVLRSHAGNDVVREEATTAAVQMIGGRGENELLWDKRGSLLNLADFLSSGLSDVSVIDLSGVNSNTLRLDFSSVEQASGTRRQMRILGSSNDRVYIGDGWRSSGTQTVFGQPYDVLQQGQITLLVAQSFEVTSLSTKSVAENRPAGTVVGTLRFGESAVTSDYTYSLVRGTGDVDNSAFVIAGNQLKTAAVFDFETKSSYSIRIRTSHPGGLSIEEVHTIQVLNQIDGTSAVDVIELRFTATNVAVTRSTNGGALVSLGVFPLTSPLELQALQSTDTVKMFGTSGNDTFRLSAAGMFVNNTRVILGGPAALQFGGEAGNDTYQFGADTPLSSVLIVETGSGVDTIDFSLTLAVDVWFNLSSVVTQIVNGNLSLRLSSGTLIENLVGGAGHDTLTGNSLANTLTGGRGNDLLIGGPGDDTYVFGLASAVEADQVTENVNEGLDTLNFGAVTTGIVVNLGSTSVQSVHTIRTLKLNSAVVIENLTGSTGADTLFGNSLDNTVTGGAGDDKLIGAAGNDLLLGGANNDTYVFVPTTVAEADQVTENANEGIDTLNFAFLTTSVVVNLASTSIQQVHTNRTLKLNSATVLENIVGGSGGDTLFGNSLDNNLTAGAGNDTLIGATGNDLLLGGADNDTYVFVPTTVAEADTVSENLNQGTDTLSFAFLTTNTIVNLGSTSVQTVHTNRTLKLNSAVVFENIIGGSGADTLFGNTLDNALTGNAGDDKLLGAAGSDSLLGGANNDTYMFVPASIAEADQVTENTNEGTDTLNFAYLTTSVAVNLGSTSVQPVHTNRTLKLNSLSTFENAVGGTASDTLLGNALANRLTGGDGNNILIGQEASDILESGSGRDILIGGLGSDILNGGTGDDILIAGRTTNDTSLTSLNTLRTQWISSNAYATRITNLRAGVGSPLVSLKAKTNVLNDTAAIDRLTGGGGTDWYFRALDDVITDLLAGETIDLL